MPFRKRSVLRRSRTVFDDEVGPDNAEEPVVVASVKNRPFRRSDGDMADGVLERSGTATEFTDDELRALEDDILGGHADSRQEDGSRDHTERKPGTGSDRAERDPSCSAKEADPGDVHSNCSDEHPGTSRSPDGALHGDVGAARAPFAVLTMNLSFAGCGFLGIYHLGVVHSFLHHGTKLLRNVQKFGGASAGSLVAAALAIRGPDKQVLEECVQFCYDMADMVRKKKLGVLAPRVSLLDPLRHFLERLLPDDAHVIARKRLFVSLTKVKTGRNLIVSDFDSKQHLIQCLLASSYIPYLTGTKPVKIGSKSFLDGGMSNNIPDIQGGRTIFVSPFSGRQHICPVDRSRKKRFVQMNGGDFQVSMNNATRALHAFFPPKRAHLDRYFERGKADCIRFLKKDNLYDGDDVK